MLMRYLLIPVVAAIPLQEALWPAVRNRHIIQQQKTQKAPAAEQYSRNRTG
jgi:hypothetical protein